MAKIDLVDVLRVRFLTGENSLRSWGIIFSILLMGFILIFSSHLVDQKVFEIRRLNDEVKELKGEFVEVRSQLQQTRLESTIKSSLEQYGLKESVKPPQKIKVIVNSK